MTFNKIMFLNLKNLKIKNKVKGNETFENGPNQPSSFKNLTS